MADKPRTGFTTSSQLGLAYASPVIFFPLLNSRLGVSGKKNHMSVPTVPSNDERRSPPPGYTSQGRSGDCEGALSDSDASSSSFHSVLILRDHEADERHPGLEGGDFVESQESANNAFSNRALTPQVTHANQGDSANVANAPPSVRRNSRAPTSLGRPRTPTRARRRRHTSMPHGSPAAAQRNRSQSVVRDRNYTRSHAGHGHRRWDTTSTTSTVIGNNSAPTTTFPVHLQYSPTSQLPGIEPFQPVAMLSSGGALEVENELENALLPQSTKLQHHRYSRSEDCASRREPNSNERKPRMKSLAQSTNYVSLSRSSTPNRHFLRFPPFSKSSAPITGIFVVDPSLDVPAGLLGQLSLNETSNEAHHASGDIGNDTQSAGDATNEAQRHIGERRKKNLKLEVENGGMDVDIYVLNDAAHSLPDGSPPSASEEMAVGTPRDPTPSESPVRSNEHPSRMERSNTIAKSKSNTRETTVFKPTRTSIDLKVAGGPTNTFSLIARIHALSTKPTHSRSTSTANAESPSDRSPLHVTASSINGYLSLHLPRTFHGLVHLTVSCGNIDRHVSLSAMFGERSTILTETPTTRAWFVRTTNFEQERPFCSSSRSRNSDSMTGNGARARESCGPRDDSAEWQGDLAQITVDAGLVRLQIEGETVWDHIRRIRWDMVGL